jgi:hypothetical protein
MNTPKPASMYTGDYEKAHGIKIAAAVVAAAASIDLGIDPTKEAKS